MFADRIDAGQRLAELVRDLPASGCSGLPVVVLALPRGGVPVGYEVARSLEVPLDVFVVRKLGAPLQPEFAIGAIASGGVRVLNEEVVRGLHLGAEEIAELTGRERNELERREFAHRGGQPPVDVRGRCVLLVDDGIATGYTMRAAVAALREKGAGRILLAAPVAARETCDSLRKIADGVLCLETPPDFVAVGQRYRDFRQTSDEEVRNLLHKASLSDADTR